MNLQRKKDEIIELYFNQSKTFREIAKITRSSPKQIKQIIDDEKQKRYHEDVIRYILQDKTIKETAIELGLNKDQIENVWLQYLQYNDKTLLIDIYSKIKESPNYRDAPEQFFKLCSDLNNKNLSITDIEELIRMQNQIRTFEDHNEFLKNKICNLEKENFDKKKENCELDLSIKIKKNEIKELEATERNLEHSLRKAQEELLHTRLSKKLIERGHTSTELKKALQELYDDEVLDNFVTTVVDTTLDNLSLRYAIYNRERLLRKIPHLDKYLDPITNIDDFCEDVLFDDTLAVIIKKCKEKVITIFLQKFFSSQHQDSV